ncbi:hypothetical protein RHODGE_RHODGE_03304 [Rhodoplanes serenus]|uniref:DUF1376 domain-containing protein n=1 Tax=Rhodoplanes serenus TaxID=200615 RepID=A0A3S4BXR4_9BRAD|nr:DUF1376 domain-containing protein [Rhodoplanes serenus]VCU10118.1 hypothetical protein RHODGE_RHODGE_03304 [Rhodoplanes serenus]
MARPWMPLYIADYRADTSHLNAAEHGAYLLLIMHYWTTGGLPDDDRQLARIACMTTAEWRRARSTVAAFFEAGWRHKRIDRELARVDETSSKYAERARKAASKRWSKPDVQQDVQQDVKHADEHASSMLGAPEPQPHPDKHGDGGDARPRDPDPLGRPAPIPAPAQPASLITPEAHALAAELAAIAGVGAGQDTPPGWCGAAHRVQTWLSRGWTRDVVLIGARASMARKRDGPPGGVGYFEPAIAREIAAQAKPIPEVVALPAKTIHGDPHGSSRQGRGDGFAALAAHYAARATGGG